MNPQPYVPANRFVFVLGIFFILCIACSAVSAEAAPPSRGFVPPSPTTSPTPPTVACQAPCACMLRSAAVQMWGADKIVQCSGQPCGYAADATGATVEKYCYQQKAVTVLAVPYNPPPVTTTPTPTYVQVIQIPVTTTTTAAPKQLVTLNFSIVSDDSDQDSIPNDKDNCPAIFNPGQDDADREFIGCPPGAVAKVPDAGAMAMCAELTVESARKKCEENAWAKANPGFTGAGCNYKSDGKGNVCDNCWEEQNIDQADSDGDCASFKKDPAFWDGKKWLKDPRCGDACDRCPNADNTIDSDKDGVPDGCDNCWNKANPDQKDSDGDCDSLKQDPTIWDSNKNTWKVDPHCGDACDNCPADWNPDQADNDKNGIGDACDCTDQFQGPYEESWDCGIKTYLGHTGHGCLNQKCKPCDLIQNGQLPQKFSWQNWRGKDWTSYVLNQGACGSCWAESAIGVTEARYYIENNKAKSMTTVWLAEQHLVSWKPEYPMGSCKGGHNPEAIDYLYEFGVANYTEFPYTSGACLDANDNCVSDCQSPYGSHCSKPGGVPSGPTDWQGRRWHISGYNSIATGNVYAAQPSPNYVIKQTILCQGPLSVSSSNWGGGHSFLLVGWSDINKTWIVENSWGNGWEDGGYAEISETDPRVDIADMWSRGSGIWYVAGVWHG